MRGAEDKVVGLAGRNISTLTMCAVQFRIVLVLEEIRCDCLRVLRHSCRNYSVRYGGDEGPIGSSAGHHSTVLVRGGVRAVLEIKAAVAPAVLPRELSLRLPIEAEYQI